MFDAWALVRRPYRPLEVCEAGVDRSVAWEARVLYRVIGLLLRKEMVLLEHVWVRMFRDGEKRRWSRL